jgi:hypothetical protein
VLPYQGDFDRLTLTVALRDGPAPFPTAFAVAAAVNGDRLPDFLHPCALPEAAARSGRYPLFTCGCDGYWVDVECAPVECAPDAWVWTNGYLPWDAPELQALVHRFQYRFPWLDAAVALAEVAHASAAATAWWPGDRIVPKRCERAFAALAADVRFR